MRRAADAERQAKERAWIEAMNARPMEVARGLELAASVMQCAQTVLARSGLSNDRGRARGRRRAGRLARARMAAPARDVRWTRGGDADGRCRTGPTSVSPDGSLLAYFGRSNNQDVWVSHIDGTGLRRVTDDAHRDRVPMWSPDVSTLVFYSNRGGKYEVWTIKQDGSGLSQISSQP